jgi:hypothetical protein
MSYGNCCSDYYECETLYERNINRAIECENYDPRCDMCTFAKEGCAQCKSGYYLRDGKCLSACEMDDRVFKTSMICQKTNRCLVENCQECEEGNPSVCNKCMNGLFLYNNSCNDVCPADMKADRMNWMCTDPSVFAWYWVFPSRTSCMGKCDVPNGQDSDCSCTADCFRYGNCCQDIEDHCYKLS